jgi:RNA polymerase sigma-70 factor, ECF subfamily
MDLDGRVQVSASRRIAAPAAEIFRVLADPAHHPALDGSGLLRAARDRGVLSRVGDTFTMAMYLPEIGDYLMLNRVIAFERDRRIVWEPTPGDEMASRHAELPIGASQGYSWGFQLRPDSDTTIVSEIFDCTEAGQGIREQVEDGRGWIPAMRQTLGRLAALVERSPGAGTERCRRVLPHDPVGQVGDARRVDHMGELQVDGEFVQQAGAPENSSP